METFVLFLILTTDLQESDWLCEGVFSTIDEAITHYNTVWKSDRIFYKIYKESVNDPSRRELVATNWSYEKHMIIYANEA